MTRGTVVVFARAPGEGSVKTRLEPALGKARTLDLHRAFLADTLEAGRASGARVVLAHTLSPPFPEQRLADAALAQRGATFGARFDHALADAFALAGGPVVLVGVDTPHLGPARLRDALDLLREAPAVLGPSTEGGFHLLGLRDAPVPVAPAFDAPGEAAAVARLLRAADLAPRLVEPCFDVDVPSDLVALVQHLDLMEATGGFVPARTARLLRAWDARAEPGGTGTRGLRLAVR